MAYVPAPRYTSIEPFGIDDEPPEPPSGWVDTPDLPLPAWVNWFSGRRAKWAVLVPWFFAYWNLALLVIPLVFGLGYVAAQAERTTNTARVAKRRDSIRQATEANYQRRFLEWRNSRPAYRIWAAQNRVKAAAEQVRLAGGTVFLGIAATSLAFRVAPRNLSVGLIGTTQRGKTTSVIIPSLAVYPGPAVVTSTKNDIFLATYKAKATQGRVLVYDPTATVRIPPGTASMVRFSLLQECSSFNGSKLQASATVSGARIVDGKDGKHWAWVAEQLLAPLFFAAANHRETTDNDVNDWLCESRFDEPATILRALRADPSLGKARDADVALKHLYSVLNANPKHRADAILSAVEALTVLGYPSAQDSVLEPNFDPHAFVRSTDTLFMLTSSDHQAATAPLFSAIIDAIVRARKELSADEPFHDSDDPPTLFLLDEAANIAPLQKLPTYLSEGGGLGAQFVVVFQTIEQSKKVWPELGKGILDYFPVVASFGGSSDRDTTEALSMLCGDYDRPYHSTSMSGQDGISWGTSSGTQGLLGYSTGKNAGGSSGSSWSKTVTYHKERALTPADVATIAPRKILLIGPGHWEVIDAASTWTDPWASVIGDSTYRDIEWPEPMPPLPAQGVPGLPSRSEIRRRIASRKAVRRALEDPQAEAS